MCLTGIYSVSLCLINHCKNCLYTMSVFEDLVKDLLVVESHKDCRLRFRGC